jgi:glycine/D-amino acid oxidase-like deaminating enzyme
MKTKPFWADDFPRPANLPVSPLPEQVDVAIVGGGYTGLSAARTLAKDGANVAVLEQGHIGHGASSLNGGQVGPGVKLGIQKVFKKFGPKVGQEVWQATLDAIDFLRQTLAEEDIDCDYTGNGVLAVAYKPSHYTEMAHKIEWLARELDYNEFDLLPPERMRTEIGSDVFHGGLIEHNGGGLHPAKYLFGLAQATAHVGVCLCEQTPALNISQAPGNRGFQIITRQGELKAGEVLLATNGYTGSLVPRIRRRVFTVGSYMITTAPLPRDLRQELNPNNRTMYDTKRFLNYFRLTPDGRMAMGGRNNLSPNLDVVASAENLTKTLIHIFPQLRGIPITHTWTGRLGITFDLMPHIGRINGIYYAFGYGGHGVAFSGYLGKEVAELMSGQRQRSVFAEIPTPTSMFYHGQVWFLPFVAAYYRFLDAIL